MRISGFPKYRVSDQGRIESLRTERILVPSVNQQGHLKVNLSKNGETYTRSVSHLVGRSYLKKPPRADFKSIIHLDGDKKNCRVSNLDWRPRHFALRYHAQFETAIFQESKMAIRDLKTGEVYPTIQEAVVRHGLLFSDIVISAHNRTYVWPTYQEFAPIDV